MQSGSKKLIDTYRALSPRARQCAWLALFCVSLSTLACVDLLVNSFTFYKVVYIIIITMCAVINAGLVVTNYLKNKQEQDRNI